MMVKIIIHDTRTFSLLISWSKQEAKTFALFIFYIRATNMGTRALTHTDGELVV